ncbi:MAG: hypothetical protein JO340_04395 [Acidobacteriaceae bacterium]|nr:hypothetical protein [Acidobacteriaceae bacterium]
MRRERRPLSVTILAWVYIAVGVIGFGYHAPELLKLEPDAFAIELTELLALAAGVFLLRGENWARWLTLAWIAFHVALSAFHTIREFAVHCVLAAAIGWVLFGVAAREWFGRREAKSQAGTE